MKYLFYYSEVFNLTETIKIFESFQKIESNIIYNILNDFEIQQILGLDLRIYRYQLTKLIATKQIIFINGDIYLPIDCFKITIRILTKENDFVYNEIIKQFDNKTNPIVYVVNEFGLMNTESYNQYNFINFNLSMTIKSIKDVDFKIFNNCRFIHPITKKESRLKYNSMTKELYIPSDRKPDYILDVEEIDNLLLKYEIQLKTKFITRKQIIEYHNQLNRKEENREFYNPANEFYYPTIIQPYNKIYNYDTDIHPYYDKLLKDLNKLVGKRFEKKTLTGEKYVVRITYDLKSQKLFESSEFGNKFIKYNSINNYFEMKFLEEEKEEFPIIPNREKGKFIFKYNNPINNYPNRMLKNLIGVFYFRNGIQGALNWDNKLKLLYVNLENLNKYYLTSDDIQYIKPESLLINIERQSEFKEKYYPPNYKTIGYYVLKPLNKLFGLTNHEIKQIITKHPEKHLRWDREKKLLVNQDQHYLTVHETLNLLEFPNITGLQIKRDDVGLPLENYNITQFKSEE